MSRKELVTQLESVREMRQIGRRKPYKRSRLERHRAEIACLVEEGASWRDIALWLRRYKRIKVHPTTVGRAITKWKNGEE